MCLYLTKRTGVYYFRRAIPEELRPAFGGAREFIFSLRTKDPAEAKRRRSEHAVRTDRELDAAKAALAQSASQTLPAASNDTPDRQRRRVRRASTAENRMHYGEFKQARYIEQDIAREEHYREQWQAKALELERRLLSGSTAELPEQEQLFRRILKDRDFNLQIASEQVLAARVAAQEAMSTTPASEPVPNIKTDTDERSAGTSLYDIVDKWAAERKVAAKTADAARATVRWFYDRVGTVAVEKITRKDVLSFKDKMLAEGVTAANTKVKLSRLRTLLQYAADNDYLPANPGAGVTVIDNDAAKNKRTEFDLPALKAIFGSPVYAADARPTQGRGEAAYWLPLLALYTGARLEELGQLRPGDVQEQTYHDKDDNELSAWVIRITEDEAEGLRLKNAGSQRIVPVHSELERLGFIKFAEDARREGRARLFDKLKADKYGRLTAKWGEWFSGYKRDVCSITDKRMVFHSFRHTFKHYARHVGMIEGVQRQIMGHSSGDVADDYGSGYSLHQLVAGMKLYRVPGFKPPAPAPIHRG